MKKLTLTLGLIGGAVVAAWGVFAAAYCDESMRSMLLGYTAMLIAFSVIFVAVKKERGGIITFGKAFRIGLMIAFIASTMYVAVWLVDYYVFMPDFMDKFAAHSIQKAQESHLSAQALKEKIDSINNMKALYKSPFWVIIFTYAEVFPVGFIVSLVAALILKRSANKTQVVGAD
jgi:FtsH-binding integral membrane protein